MEREIKFRAWDKKSKIMKYDINIISNSFGELLQFTGLKDKNGKEIYEGDIIEYFHWCYCSNDCSNKKDEKQIKKKFTDAYGNSHIDCYVPLKGIVKWNKKALTYEPLVDSCDDYNSNSFGYVCNGTENIDKKNYPDSYIKVIGNIYENPELFDKEVNETN